jgi:hypothetical protein
MRTRTVLALVYVAATSALGCGGKLEDGSASSAKTYGALDVADGTCAPVVAQTVACGALPSFAAICTAGTKPAVHVLQQDLGGGATGTLYECIDANGVVVAHLGAAGTSCSTLGDLYALAYQDCAHNGHALGSFKTTSTCSLPATTCSVVVTCCPG